MNANPISTGGLREWVVSVLFVVCAGWAVWHTPAFILDLFPPADTSAVDRMTANRNTDIITLSGLVGDAAAPTDAPARATSSACYPASTARPPPRT